MQDKQVQAHLHWEAQLRPHLCPTMTSIPCSTTKAGWALSSGRCAELKGLTGDTHKQLVLLRALIAAETAADSVLVSYISANAGYHFRRDGSNPQTQAMQQML